MARKKALIALFTVVGLGQSPQHHKRLEWTGACVVDIMHTPCRTVRYHEFGFGRSLHFDGMWRSESVEAVGSDGSESNARALIWRRFYFFPRVAQNVTELILRRENRTVYMDPERRIYETHAGAVNRWKGFWEEDDSQCSYTKTFQGSFDTRLSDSNVAGVPVVGYRGQDHQGVEYEAYFAPSIGCQTMVFRTAVRGFLGLKIAEYERVVDSFEIGPPAPDLFTIPNGYKQVASIHP